MTYYVLVFVSMLGGPSSAIPLPMIEGNSQPLGTVQIEVWHSSEKCEAHLVSLRRRGAAGVCHLVEHVRERR